MLHLGRDLAVRPGRRIKSGAQGAAGVVRGRLDENLVEHVLEQQTAGHGAIQGNAPRHRQSPMPGHGAIVPKQMAHHLLERFLQACGEVHVLLRDGFMPAARLKMIVYDGRIPALHAILNRPSGNSS